VPWRADGGTLLLDEIADMPLETQGKVLRALQERSYTRPGGNNRREVDVRVVATTNRNLQAEMSAGRSARISTTASRRADRAAAPGRAPHRHPGHGPPLHGGGIRRIRLAARKIADDAMAVLQDRRMAGRRSASSRTRSNGC
jgi:two-component system nitrogen regulation response regulator NtrX